VPDDAELYCPAAQGVHVDEPAIAEVPAGHGSQVDEGGEVDLVPAEQVEHPEAPALLYSPALHWVHEVAPAPL